MSSIRTSSSPQCSLAAEQKRTRLTWRGSQIQIYATADILTEYQEVLRRSKFRRISPKAIGDALELIRRIAILVDPKEKLVVSSDVSSARMLRMPTTW